MTSSEYDPFNDRLARDIRNTLSKSFMVALDSGNLDPVNHEVDKFFSQDIDKLYTNYIRERISRYMKCLDEIKIRGIKDPLRQALILWNNGLFFEVHERLEDVWMTTDGDERKALQGLIRAAGTYVHLQNNHNKAATSMAAKAVTALSLHHNKLPFLHNYEVLIKHLKDLRLDPPTLN